jgi:hypothetical protein
MGKLNFREAKESSVDKIHFCLVLSTIMSFSCFVCQCTLLAFTKVEAPHLKM